MKKLFIVGYSVVVDGGERILACKDMVNATSPLEAFKMEREIILRNIDNQPNIELLADNFNTISSVSNVTNRVYVSSIQTIREYGERDGYKFTKGINTLDGSDVYVLAEAKDLIDVEPGFCEDVDYE